MGSLKADCVLGGDSQPTSPLLFSSRKFALGGQDGAWDAKCVKHTQMWEGTVDRTRAVLGHGLQRNVRLNDNVNDTHIEDGSNMC